MKSRLVCPYCGKKLSTGKDLWNEDTFECPKCRKVSYVFWDEQWNKKTGEEIHWPGLEEK